MIMINTKEDLLYYLEEDKKALGISVKRPCFRGADVWKFQIALRYAEYYMNIRSNLSRGGAVKKLLLKFPSHYWNVRYYNYSMRLGFDIPRNVFGPGLNIHHYGCIVVNAHAKVGKNCNLQQHTTIGQGSRGDYAVIGDNVFIGTGAKIIGPVHIADNCQIGANAVVTKDFLEEGSIIAGVPAKVIGKVKK